MMASILSDLSFSFSPNVHSRQTGNCVSPLVSAGCCAQDITNWLDRVAAGRERERGGETHRELE